MRTQNREFLGKLAYDTFNTWPTPQEATAWEKLEPVVQERWRCSAQDVMVLFSNNRPWQDYVPSWLNVTADSLSRWQSAAQAVENTTPDMGAPSQGISDA